jgi:hypothetical protein
LGRGAPLEWEWSGRRLSPRLREIEHLLAHARVLDAVVGAHELERLALGERVGLVIGGSLVEAAIAAARGRCDLGRHLVEEELDRHVEDLGELIEPARADPVRAALVFLDLLEGQPQGLGQLLLAHPEHGPPQADAGAHMRIDGAWTHQLHACGAPPSFRSASHRHNVLDLS